MFIVSHSLLKFYTKISYLFCSFLNPKLALSRIYICQMDEAKKRPNKFSKSPNSYLLFISQI